MQSHFRRTWKVGLVMLAALFVAASTAEASLLFDLRARDVSGPGVTKVDNKTVDVVAPGGKIIFDVWAVIQGADAALTNDRLQLYSFRLKSSGNGFRGNMFNDWAANPNVGPINGWETGAGAAPGTLQDLDADGDMDIGAAEPVWLTSTDGNANGRNTAPTAYNGGGSVAEFLVYSFEQNIASLGGGQTMMTLERSPVGTAFLWREDAAAGFNKNGTNATVAVGPGVAVNVIPEPGTIALALLGVAGVALAIRRRKS